MGEFTQNPKCLLLKIRTSEIPVLNSYEDWHIYIFTSIVGNNILIIETTKKANEDHYDGELNYIFETNCTSFKYSDGGNNKYFDESLAITIADGITFTQDDINFCYPRGRTIFSGIECIGTFYPMAPSSDEDGDSVELHVD